MASSNIGNMFVTLSAKTARFQQGFKKAGSSVNQFEKQTKKSFMGFDKSMAKSMAGFGLAFGAAGLISKGIDTISDFEQAMADVKSITNATTTEFNKLSEQARQLGGTTKFTATEIAGMQKELAKLGFGTGEIIAATEAISQLAAATGSEIGESARVAAETVRGFGMAASDTQQVVDVMAKSFSSSSLDMEKFSVAMANVSTVAKLSGLSMERTSALIGTLTDRGIDASKAGTDLRKILLELSKQGLTWNDAMQQIRDSTDKNLTSLNLFGIRAAAAGVIFAENETDIRGLTDAYNESAGAAKEMADIQLNTLQGSATLLESAWDGLMLTFSDSAGAMKAVVDGLTKIITKVTQLTKYLSSTENELSWLEQLDDFWLGDISMHSREKETKRIIDNLIDGTKKAQDEIRKRGDLMGSMFFNDAEDLANQLELQLILEEEKRKEIEKQAKAAADLAKEKEKEYQATLKLFDLFKDRAGTTKLVGRLNKETTTLEPTLREAPALPYTESDKAKADKARELRNEILFDEVEVVVKRFGNIVADMIGSFTDFGHVFGAASSAMAAIGTGNFVAAAEGIMQFGKVIVTEVLKRSEAFAETMRIVNEGMNQFFEELAKIIDEELGDEMQELGRAYADIMSELAGITGELLIAMMPLVDMVLPFVIDSLKGFAIMLEAISSTLEYVNEIYKSFVDAGAAVTGGGLSVPAFATGGMVSGPTLAMVGDNPNARFDPEVIAPLSKLKGMMGDKMQVTGRLVASGDELIAVINSANRNNSYSVS